MLYIHVCPSTLGYVKVLTNSEPFGAGRPPRGDPLQSNGATAHFPPLLLIGAESTRGEKLLMPSYAKFTHMKSLVLINTYIDTATMCRWPPNVPSI